MAPCSPSGSARPVDRNRIREGAGPGDPSALQEAWRFPIEVGSPFVGRAAGLLAILADLGPRYGVAHPEALGRATECATELAASERPEVVCHGDPHPGNVLRRGTGWALIDPDGLLASAPTTWGWSSGMRAPRSQRRKSPRRARAPTCSTRPVADSRCSRRLIPNACGAGPTSSASRPGCICDGTATPTKRRAS